MAMLAAKFVTRRSMALPLTAQTVSPDMASHAQAATEAEHRGDFLSAVHEYEYLTRQLPRSAEMQSTLGVALYFNHQWQQAIVVLRKAMTLSPNCWRRPVQRFWRGINSAKPDAAVPELETAVRLRSSTSSRHMLGYAYVAQSRYDAAAKTV